MPVATALLLIVLFAAMAVGRLQLPSRGWPVPWLTLFVIMVLAIALGAQLLFPSLLGRFERDPGAIGHGALYRLFTALWFQDGGLAGGVFNLVILFLLGSVSERLWDRRAWLVLYFGAGLAAACIALAWQPVGAGNSIACLGLAGGMLLPDGARIASWPIAVLRAIGLVAGAALAVIHDIHGAALLIGVALAFPLVRIGWRLS